MSKFEITKSPHGMKCISIINPTREQRYCLRRALQANRMEDPFYAKRQLAHPFLQSDSKDYILVEFWTDSATECQKYVDWLNSVFDQEINRALQMFDGELPL